MGLLLTFTFSMMLWIVLWSLGFKAFDGFMIVTLIMIIAAAFHIIAPHLPGKRASS